MRRRTETDAPQDMTGEATRTAPEPTGEVEIGETLADVLRRIRNDEVVQLHMRLHMRRVVQTLAEVGDTVWLEKLGYPSRHPGLARRLSVHFALVR